jgi:tetratricopeptide (TPR) repeat protein
VSARAVAFAVALSLSGAALAQEAKDAEFMMAQGQKYFEQQNWQAAIAMFNGARTIAPERPGPYLWLGLAHAAAGQCEQALPFLESYLKRKQGEPKPEALRTLADCKVKTQKQPGRLRVTSEPAGAEVRLDRADGAPAGVTPFETAEIAIGPHRVFLDKPGFQQVVEQVSVEAGMIAAVRIPLVRVAPVEQPRPPVEQPRPPVEQPRPPVEQPPPPSSVAAPFAPGLEPVQLCAVDPAPTFCGPVGPIPKEEFARRLKLVTGLELRERRSGAAVPLLVVGTILTGIGFLTTVVGAAVGGDNDCKSAGKCMWAIGLGLMIPGIPLLAVGAVKMKRRSLSADDARDAVERYNQELERRRRSALLISPTGVAGTFQ